MIAATKAAVAASGLKAFSRALTGRITMRV
jgi:hypothetical protein